MANILADGVAWQSEQLQYNAGTTVTLRRGGKTGSFTATLGESLFDGQGDGGATTLVRSRDFLVPIADYKTTGEAASEPHKTDILIATIAGVEKRHMVLETADGRFFRRDDQGQRYRIHTKEVS